jgi:hypothetical protein
MRRGSIAALAALILVALPGTALGAKPAPVWPTVHDLQQEEPGLRVSDAACIVRFYRGRLSAKAWHTQWYALTRAQKLVTDAGEMRCLDKAERIATTVRGLASVVGAHAELPCAGRGLEALSLAERLTFTTRAREMREYDRIFRACRLTGVLYASVGSETHLALSGAEQTCANRLGAIAPVLHPKGARIPDAYLKAIGTVFDKCVGAKSEEAMYRWIFRQYPIPAQIPCIARSSAATITFADLLTSAPSAKTHAQSATAACLAGKKS